MSRALDSIVLLVTNSVLQANVIYRGQYIFLLLKKQSYARGGRSSAICRTSLGRQTYPWDEPWDEVPGPRTLLHVPLPIKKP
jgi:hypothetical protein